MIFRGDALFVIGLMNPVVPLQIGARYAAFPSRNNLSFWPHRCRRYPVNPLAGRKEFAQTGWLAYPPPSGIEYVPALGSINTGYGRCNSGIIRR